MCQNETRDIRALLTEVTEALEDMVWQHCQTEDGEIDSMALSANVDAIELLIRLGRLERKEDSHGRQVFATARPPDKKGVI